MARSGIRNIRFGVTEHVTGDDYQALICGDGDICWKMLCVIGGEISADDGDITVVELPDIRTAISSVGLSQLARRLSQPPRELRGWIRFPGARHGHLRIQSPHGLLVLQYHNITRS